MSYYLKTGSEKICLKDYNSGIELVMRNIIKG